METFHAESNKTKSNIMEENSKKVEHETDELKFKYLQRNLNLVELPSSNWGFSSGNDTFFGFMKAESDFSVRKRIAVFPNLHINIYIDDKIMPFSKHIKVTSIDDISEILKTADSV
ncbi:unnamed protein product [Lasius platythorax]|uniref:Uncharacterized protein n=1 Tax=Lasius platythorax TaxID=488582 RepID=A0AAV2NUB4_9HYME